MTRVRRDVGTDTARIGIWDSSFTAMGSNSLKWNAAEERSRVGELFYVSTGADCGCPLEVYINEEVPVELVSKLHRAGKSYLLRVTSGKVTVGGVEDFGASKRIITGDADDIPVASGTYQVQCFLPGPEASPPEPITGRPAAVATYHAVTWLGRLGCLGFLVAAACAVLEILRPVLWISSAIVGVSWLLSWGLSRTAAYKSVAPREKPEPEVELPIVFQVHPADPSQDLQGGFVSME